MNAVDKYRLACAANDILQMWHNLIEESNGNTWYKHEVRQAYHDAMNFMLSHKLIEDFNVQNVSVKIGGQWSSARVFIRTGEH